MNKFRKPFNSKIKSFIVKRFSSMSRKELRKKMRNAADAIPRRIVDLPTITTKGILK